MIVVMADVALYLAFHQGKKLCAERHFDPPGTTNNSRHLWYWLSCKWVEAVACCDTQVTLSVVSIQENAPGAQAACQPAGYCAIFHTQGDGDTQNIQQHTPGAQAA